MRRPLAILMFISAHLSASADDAPRFSAKSSAETWKLLGREDGPPLPSWARTLAPSMPRTVAGMLHLNYFHRETNPLGSVSAAKLRWAAADAIGCVYARQYAEFDLRRAKASDADLDALRTGKGLSADAAAMVHYARKATLSASALTDDEMEALLKRFGPEKLVAMVHTVAFANFENRVFLALGAKAEGSELIPPIDYPIRAEEAKALHAPPREPWGADKIGPVKLSKLELDWRPKSADELKTLLDKQKARTARIPLPDVERFAELPPAAKDQATRIVWTRVMTGYQPQMTIDWFDMLGAYQRESKLDRSLSQLMFWVITRGNECFY
jgi:alkylhydroperoxidase family enzyme